MTIDWRVLTDYIGIGYGYSTHQKRLSEALVRNGVKMSSASPYAVHLTTPEAFEPVEGKMNILYTMYECTDIPPKWIAPLQKADLIVVPCRQNIEIFKKHVKVPVELCWEGCETDKYSFVEREFPKDRPFVFLWVGATNPRKGTEHLIAAWERWNLYWFKRDPSVREKAMLVMKTTQETPRECAMEVEYVDKSTGAKFFKSTMSQTVPAERVMVVAGNAVVDTRRLPIRVDEPIDYKLPKSLAHLYQAAHCFVFPTRGEGFGLTLAEAMSTGLPSIYTPWSGPKDFCDDTMGYSLKFGFSSVRTIAIDPATKERYVSHESWAADADPDHICRRMIQVYADYESALAKGRKAAAHIRAGFTWDHSAQSFIKILERYTNQTVEVAA